MGVFGKLKEKTSELKTSDKMEELKNKANAKIEAGKEKSKEALQKTLEKIKKIKPLLKESGFIIGNLDIMLAFPLGINVVVEKTEEGTGKIEDLLENDDLSKIQKSLIGAIIQV